MGGEGLRPRCPGQPRLLACQPPDPAWPCFGLGRLQALLGAAPHRRAPWKRGRGGERAPLGSPSNAAGSEKPEAPQRPPGAGQRKVWPLRPPPPALQPEHPRLKMAPGPWELLWASRACLGDQVEFQRRRAGGRRGSRGGTRSAPAGGREKQPRLQRTLLTPANTGSPPPPSFPLPSPLCLTHTHADTQANLHVNFLFL